MFDVIRFGVKDLFAHWRTKWRTFWGVFCLWVRKKTIHPTATFFAFFANFYFFFVSCSRFGFFCFVVCVCCCCGETERESSFVHTHFLLLELLLDVVINWCELVIVIIVVISTVVEQDIYSQYRHPRQQHTTSCVEQTELIFAVAEVVRYIDR